MSETALINQGMHYDINKVVRCAIFRHTRQVQEVRHLFPTINNIDMNIDLGGIILHSDLIGTQGNNSGGLHNRLQFC